MKTVGIIGGIAPESTIEYYRLIIERYRKEKGDGTYPSIMINSIDLTRMLTLVAARDRARLSSYLIREVRRLAGAGADFALFASNTPHIVFEDVARQSPIPLVSLVDATRAAVEALGFKKVALLGTRFTMLGTFYPESFSARNIDIVVPMGEDQDYVHDKYMSELVHAVYLDQTRKGILRIVARLRESEGIEAVILGGTELPLLFRDFPITPVPFLDTMKIHVEEVVTRLLEQEERYDV